jgi:acid phosphatase type 7
MKNKHTLLFILISIVYNGIVAQTAIIPTGASWKYKDDGSNQGTAWYGTSFSDAGWAAGAGQLGYGDNDETTTVNAGCTPVATCNTKFITTYFRKTVTIPCFSIYSSFTLNVYRDDGCVVYVNGVEIGRSNIAAGAVTYTTTATAAADDGNTPVAFAIPVSGPGSLTAGTNVIAVEIHQTSAVSSDITFDLNLNGNISNNIIRGPYLQMGTQNAVTLRWKTTNPTTSSVWYGASAAALTSRIDSTTNKTEHEVRITGLTTDTRYYYSIGNNAVQMICSDTTYTFNTAPADNSTRKIRIGAFGDCGRNVNGVQSATLGAYRNFIGNNIPDLWLLLGDNAYDGGLDAEYNSNFFNVYGSTVLRNHMLYPVPGNHDYNNNTTLADTKNIPYYTLFNLPKNGEAGGLASGTEAYYSFDYGPIHFLALDSYGTENSGTTRLYDTAGAQAIWVKNDLAVNTKKWVVAYWHHPPYTKGSHNSDTESSDLGAMRQRFITILERNGVDLILCGHSHDYERSYLLKGHYGLANSFNKNTHTTDSSSAVYDGTTNSCPYTYNTGKINHGTVYVVAGSSGADGVVVTGEWPMPALPFAQSDGGALYFEVEDNRLDAKFIRKDGTIADRFTIMKDVKKKTTFNVANGASLNLTASYIGNYNWTNTTGSTRTVTITAPGNTITQYYVQDNMNCIKDTFEVNASTIVPLQLVHFDAALRNSLVQITFTVNNEYDVHHYTIERSSNGVTFNTLATVTAFNTGNTDTYHFTDDHPLKGKNFYRLVETRNDQTTKIWGVKMVNNTENKRFQLIASSNTNELQISISGYEQQQLQLNVFDMAGRNVYAETLNTTNGSRYRKSLALPKGIYLVEIATKEGFKETRNVVVN